MLESKERESWVGKSIFMIGMQLYAYGHLVLKCVKLVHMHGEWGPDLTIIFTQEKLTEIYW